MVILGGWVFLMSEEPLRRLRPPSSLPNSESRKLPEFANQGNQDGPETLTHGGLRGPEDPRKTGGCVTKFAPKEAKQVKLSNSALEVARSAPCGP